ncbi:MAG: hypothetical protein WDN25_13125 [Acetobacteraceae bacterium]
MHDAPSPQDDGRRWGYMLPDGTFRAIPKQPMLMGGYGPPPFTLARPDGQVLHIVSEPDGGADA